MSLLKSVGKFLPAIGIVCAFLFSLVSVAVATGYLKLPFQRATEVQGLGQLVEWVNDLRAGQGSVDQLFRRVSDLETKTSEDQVSPSVSDSQRKFIDQQAAALASDQFMKDNTRVTGSVVEFHPPFPILSALFFPKRLWDAYPTKEMQASGVYYPTSDYTMTWFQTQRGFGPFAHGSLVFAYEEGPALSSVAPADCVGDFDEMHRKAATLFEVPCTVVQKIQYPRMAGCAFLTRGEIIAPGPVVYLAEKVRPEQPKTDENGYPVYPEDYASAEFLFPPAFGVEGGPGRKLKIAAKPGGGFYYLADDREKMISDLQQVVDAVVEKALAASENEYAGCY